MDNDEDPLEFGEGDVVLCRDGWHAVMGALHGEESCLDAAFDALQRWAPQRWLREIEERFG